MATRLSEVAPHLLLELALEPASPFGESLLLWIENREERVTDMVPTRVTAWLLMASIAVVPAAAHSAEAAQAAVSPPQSTSAPFSRQAKQGRTGEDLFTDYGCGNCHTLAKAGATGHVGPSFDGNTNLSPDFVVERVTNGQGMMPAFTGQMSPEEVAILAKYVTEAASK
jgi:mono/diheme cytochrome c family protein